MNLITGGLAALMCIGGLVSLAATSALSTDVPSTSAVLEAAAGLGIDPESLAGVGVRSGGVDDVLDALADRAADLDALAGLEATLRTLTSEMEDARAKLREDAGDEAARQALARAESSAAATKQSTAASREAILLAVLRGQAEPDSIRRVFLGLHGAQRLPVAYRFAPESAEEATRLAWALDIARVSQGRGETPPADAVAAVSAAEGQIDVQMALQNVTAHTEPNRIAFDQWASQQ